MVRVQLSSRSKIREQVLLEVLAADSYVECTTGPEASVSTHSLIPGRPRSCQRQVDIQSFANFLAQSVTRRLQVLRGWVADFACRDGETPHRVRLFMRVVGAELDCCAVNCLRHQFLFFI